MVYHAECFFSCGDRRLEHIICRVNKIDILDNRYQISEKNKVDEISLSAELNLSAKSRMKFEYENRVESESRLNSESDQDSYSYELRYRITKNFTWHSVLAYHDDLGSETDLAYTNSTIECKNDFTYFWNRKYRLIGKFNYKRNKREGAQSNAYLDRNNGNAFNWDLFLNYRINYYTYASIKYQGDKNPGLDTVHKFSVEMMALEDVVILRDLCNNHLNSMVKKVSVHS